jgi:hypothetical protein
LPNNGKCDSALLEEHADAHNVEVERSDRFKRFVSKNKTSKKAGAL